MTVNAHTHLYSGLVPFGMPAPQPAPRTFPEILERVWWRLDRALDERSLRAAARLYIAEARLAGTTMIIDHHESPNMIEGSLDILAEACEEFGMRALLCYGATERNGGRDEARRGLAECRRFITSNRRPLVRGAVGLHAAFTVSDETIRAAGMLCRDLDVPLHVHVAEDVIDKDGLKRLMANDGLVRGSILAHGVHLLPEEVRLTERLGCWLVQNPRSNRANGVGYGSVLRNSSRVALGTDGFPSDMNAEAAALEEPEEIAARRLAAGEALATEIFGDVTPSVSEGPGRADGTQMLPPEPSRPLADARGDTSFDIERIRLESAVEAARLWERMRGVNHEEPSVAKQRR